MHILIANGVNLDLLGSRDQEVYGNFTLKELQANLDEEANFYRQKLNLNLKLHHFQTNSEEEYLNILTLQKFDGAILNPGAWTHTSLALGDRLAALKLLFIEVHLSSPLLRSNVRSTSYISPYAFGVISGMKIQSYTSALKALVDQLK